MPQLKFFPWWANDWFAEKDKVPTPEGISRDAILKNVRRVDNTLDLVVNYKGATYTATIKPNISDDALVLLRHILLQHYGEPMEVVERINIDF